MSSEMNVYPFSQEGHSLFGQIIRARAQTKLPVNSPTMNGCWHVIEVLGTAYRRTHCIVESVVGNKKVGRPGFQRIPPIPPNGWPLFTYSSSC